MLLQTLSVVRSNITLFLVFPLILVAAFVLGDVYKIDPGNASAFVWAFLGFFVQQALIMNDGHIMRAKKAPKGLFAFLAKYFVVLFLFPLIPPMAAVTLLIGAIGANLSTILGVILFVVFQACLMTILGTWPISGAVKADTSINAAWQREKSGRFPRFLRLLAGTALPLIVQFPVGLAAIRAAEGADFTDLGKLSTAGGLYFIANCAAAFGTAYTSVVIANVFVKKDLANDPGARPEMQFAPSLGGDTPQPNLVPHAIP